MKVTKMQSSKDKLRQLQTVISKLPLQVCCTSVLPEFHLRWSEVSQAVRNSRLPMSSASVARVLCRHAGTLPLEELTEICARLTLKQISIQNRTWHVIHLLEPTSEEPFAVVMRTLPRRIKQALKNGKIRNMRPEVNSIMINDLLYISVQLVSESRESSVLYLATPPGQPVALVTSLASGMLKPCVEGLGYTKYTDAKLHGKDIPSLLQISDPQWTTNADHLVSIPEYNPQPIILANGIDYTNKTYDINYVDSLLGPNPPKLTDLTVKTSKEFFGKPLIMTMALKSDDIAGTLKNWVAKGALNPTSDLFKIFHKTKSNHIEYDRDSD